MDTTLARFPRMRCVLRRRMQVVFQDPYSSPNPRLRVETIVGDALRVHGLVKEAAQCQARVAELLTRVGLSPQAALRYPHEFSGGERQRIGIARALPLRPGEPPSLHDPPTGCALYPRCPLAELICRELTPGLEGQPGTDSGHRVACHFADRAGDAQNPPHPIRPA